MAPGFIRHAKNVPYTSSSSGLSRIAIIKWVNAALQSDLLKVEQLGSGAEYCSLMNKLFPECIPMKRVKFNCQMEKDCYGNFKLLLASFKKTGVKKDVPMEKLVKCRFKDNYQFAQWFKAFFDANVTEAQEKCKPIPARADPILGMHQFPPDCASKHYLRANVSRSKSIPEHKSMDSKASVIRPVVGAKQRSKSVPRSTPQSSCASAYVISLEERVLDLCSCWKQLEGQADADFELLKKALNLLKTEYEQIEEPSPSFFKVLDIITSKIKRK